MIIITNLCIDCPDGVRGLCCHVNIPIEGYNIVLDHVYCSMLDPKTQFCSDYKNRKQYKPWCLHGENMFNRGGLPKGCLYLIGHPEREANPKISIFEVIDNGDPKKVPEIIGKYNQYNNVPFEVYEEHLKT